MTEPRNPGGSDRSDFDERHSELTQKAYKLAREISAWAKAIAREELGDEIVANGEAYYETLRTWDPLNDDEPHELDLRKRCVNQVDDYVSMELVPKLIKAYATQADLKSNKVVLSPSVLEDRLFIGNNRDAFTRSLTVEPNEPLGFLKTNDVLTPENIEEAEQIVNDLEAAFWQMLKEQDQPSVAPGYADKSSGIGRRMRGVLPRRWRKSRQ